MKTALVLSGGGARGGYQVGVWKALRKLNIEIDIVVGTSVGAINSIMVAQDKFDDAVHLWESTNTWEVFDILIEKIDGPIREIAGVPIEEAFGYAKELREGGAEATGLSKLLDEYLEEDKVRNSRITYGLVVTEKQNLKGRYLTIDEIPNGKLKDFVIASAACYPAAKYYTIDGVDYIDGGYSDNLPIDLALSLGAERIVAVNLEAIGKVKSGSLRRGKKNAKEFYHITSNWPTGNFLAFDPKNSDRNINMGFLDGMKTFGKLKGLKYTFEDTSEISNFETLDFIGETFDLDYSKCYTIKSFNDEIKDKIKDPLIDIGLLDRKFNRLKNQLTFHSIKSLIKEFKLEETDKIFLLLVAYDIKNNKESSKFLSKHVIKMLRKEIFAANYLIKNNFI